MNTTQRNAALKSLDTAYYRRTEDINAAHREGQLTWSEFTVLCRVASRAAVNVKFRLLFAPATN